MVRISRFIQRQGGHLIRNALAGGVVSCTANGTDGGVVSGPFGGFGVSSVNNNGVTLTWDNNSSTVTPILLVNPVSAASDSTNAGSAARRIYIAAGQDHSSALVFQQGLNATAAVSTGAEFNVCVVGHIKGGGGTT